MSLALRRPYTTYTHTWPQSHNASIYTFTAYTTSSGKKNVIDSNFTGSKRQDIQNVSLAICIRTECDSDDHVDFAVGCLYARLDACTCIYSGTNTNVKIIIRYVVCMRVCPQDGRRWGRKKMDPENWAIVPFSMQWNSAARWKCKENRLQPKIKFFEPLFLRCSFRRWWPLLYFIYSISLTGLFRPFSQALSSIKDVGHVPVSSSSIDFSSSFAAAWIWLHS